MLPGMSSGCGADTVAQRERVFARDFRFLRLLAYNGRPCANLADGRSGLGWVEARLGRRERSDRSRARHVNCCCAQGGGCGSATDGIAAMKSSSGISPWASAGRCSKGVGYSRQFRQIHSSQFSVLRSILTEPLQGSETTWFYLLGFLCGG